LFSDHGAADLEKCWKELSKSSAESPRIVRNSVVILVAEEGALRASLDKIAPEIGVIRGGTPVWHGACRVIIMVVEGGPVWRM